MSILPWSYKLAMCWYSLILKRRTSPDKSENYFTENIFVMPFKQRKPPGAHQGSERERQDIGVFAIRIGEVDVGRGKAWPS